MISASVMKGLNSLIIRAADFQTSTSTIILATIVSSIFTLHFYGYNRKTLVKNTILKFVVMSLASRNLLDKLFDEVFLEVYLGPLAKKASLVLN